MDEQVNRRRIFESSAAVGNIGGGGRVNRGGGGRRNIVFICVEYNRESIFILY
jgi:hypothetical protein